MDYRDAMRAEDIQEVRKAIEEEAKATFAKSDLAGMENKEIRAHCGTWEPVPDSGNIDRLFVARPTIGNALKAMKDRHFKLGAGVGEMTELGKRHNAEAFRTSTPLHGNHNEALQYGFELRSRV